MTELIEGKSIKKMENVVDMMKMVSLYIKALESYLSQLDEAFDKILEEANKIAKREIKEILKERPQFYQ